MRGRVLSPVEPGECWSTRGIYWRP